MMKSSQQADTTHSLDSAPQEVQLAVDLIYLLETNEIDPQTAIKALKMVIADCEKKL
ncbi:pleiotropic regulatory protein RsmS [Thaumasiovibrio sp. DFM-14]|uniref:pleiotropic regulatory protein RsmS n=1 Tax=Thaumasiovibrio sp. DFM-14 TaxID=3384792 RepID=UPI0039A1112D